MLHFLVYFLIFNTLYLGGLFAETHGSLFQEVTELKQKEPIKYNLDWKVSRKPWALYIGETLPDDLKEGGILRKIFESRGFSFIHFAEKKVPKPLRKIAVKNNFLNLAHHDGLKRQQVSPEKIRDMSIFSQEMDEYVRKNLKRRLERLENRVNHHLKILARMNVSDRVVEKSSQALLSFAHKEPVSGLEKYVQTILVERKKKMVTIQSSSARITSFRTVRLEGGAGGAPVGIELPGTNFRSVNTTVSPP